MAELPDSVREAIEDKNFWHLATLNPDGSPQSTPVWVDMRNGNIIVNTFLGRTKQRNLDHDARVALSLHDAENPYSNMAIQGRVVDRVVGPEAESDIDALSEKYTGKSPYPWREPGQARVTYLIEPMRVWERA